MKRKNVLKVLSLPLTALMLVSGWQIYSALSIQQKAKEEFADLAALVAPPVSKPTTAALLEENAPSQESTEPTEVLRDLTELFAQNEECIGWLSIPCHAHAERAAEVLIPELLRRIQSKRGAVSGFSV